MNPQQDVNFSSGDTVPAAQANGIDPNMSAGNYLFSTSDPGHGMVSLNPTAFSLNNIAQTGAPFDVKDSVYNMFRRERRLGVSEAQGVGTELFRLSLDPSERNGLIRAYMDMHEDFVPGIDFRVYFGGASGTVGSLVMGWVNDASDKTKTYTLEDLERVQSYEFSLNQPSTVIYTLNDTRIGNMYRKIKDDQYPYPGIVCLVSTPISNVNRNDLVDYSITIYTKLSHSCILASPRSININPGPQPGSSILLSKFIFKTFDFVLNTHSVLNQLIDPENYDDCGFYTGNFSPLVANNIYGYTTSHFSNNNPTVYVSKFEDFLPAIRNNPIKPEGASCWPLNVIFTAYGDVPETKTKNFGNNTTVLSSAVQWTIQPLKLKIGTQVFECNTIYIYPNGVVFAWKTQYETITYEGTTYHVVQVDPDREEQNHIIPTPYRDYDEANNREVFILENDGQWRRNYAAGNLAYKEAEEVGLVYTYTVEDKPGHILDDTDMTIVIPPLYAFTFLGQSNTHPTSDIGPDVSAFYFTTPGSSLARDITVFPPLAAGAQNLINSLELICEQLQTKVLSMYYSSDGKVNEFAIGYSNGIFFARTQQTQLIRTGISNKGFLRDIKPIDNIYEVVPFVAKNFAPYVTSNFKTATKPFDISQIMQGMQKQAAIAAIAGASIIGGIASGIGQGISDANKLTLSYKELKALENRWNLDRQNYSQNQELNRKLQTELMIRKNIQQNRIQKSQQDFDLSLRGFSSTSAQSGNLVRASFAPQSDGSKSYQQASVLPSYNKAEPPKELKTNDVNGKTFTTKGEVDPISKIKEPDSELQQNYEDFKFLSPTDKQIASTKF